MCLSILESSFLLKNFQRSKKQSTGCRPTGQGTKWELNALTGEQKQKQKYFDLAPLVTTPPVRIGLEVASPSDTDGRVIKYGLCFFCCCCFSLVFSLLLYSPLLLAYAIDGFKLGRLYIIKYLRNTRSKGLWKGYGRAIMRTLGTVIINCDVEKETECMRERGIESVGLIKLVRKSKAQVPHGWAHVIARGFFDL